MTEIFAPRTVSVLGLWTVGKFRIKAYGICADGQTLNPVAIEDARRFAEQELPRRAEAQGDDDALGFAIVHQGTAGVTILVHWWAQGSVLCQALERIPSATGIPLDQSNRSSIACVWELGLINAEQQIWRDTMMTENANPEAYANSWAEVTEV